MTSDLAVREHSVTERLDEFKAYLTYCTKEEFVKHATQVETVVRTIENLPTRSEVEAIGLRLTALDQALDRLEQLTCSTKEEFVKHATQVETVVRTIENLPTRSEVEAPGLRLGALDEKLIRLEQMVVALHEKTDVVTNRANRVLLPLDDDTVLVRSVVGYLYCSRNDHAVLTGLAESGEFEPGLRRLLERVLEPGMTFLDVGAHLGLHTLAAARRVGKGGRVFSLSLHQRPTIFCVAR